MAVDKTKARDALEIAYQNSRGGIDESPFWALLLPI